MERSKRIMINRINSLIVSGLYNCLSLLNRDELSKTNGCFDKDYWYLKKTSFFNGMKQNYIYSLSLFLYLIQEKENIRTDNSISNKIGNIISKEMLQYYIQNSIEFSLNNQNKDGSFDEHYLNEKSIVATTFIFHSILKSLEIMHDLNKDINLNLYLTNKIKKQLDWIVSHKEKKIISNHLSGKVLSMFLGFLFFNEQKYYELFEKELLSLLNIQNREGWFPEYKGTDFGYLTLTLKFLTELYLILKKAKSSKFLIESLEKSLSSLLNFFNKIYMPKIHNFGHLWFRRTNHFFIGGFLNLLLIHKKYNILDTGVARKYLYNYIDSLKNFDLEVINDSNFGFFQLNDLLENYDLLLSIMQDKSIQQQKLLEKGDTLLENQGFYKKSYGNSIFCNSYKFKNSIIINNLINEKSTLIDTGIALKLTNGDIYTSNLLKSTSINLVFQNKVKRENLKKISILGIMRKYRNYKMTPLKQILMNIAGCTFLKNTKLNSFIKNNLIENIVYENSSFNKKIHYEKEIKFENNSVLKIKEKVIVFSYRLYENIESIFHTHGLQTIFIPSSEYFVKNQYGKRELIDISKFIKKSDNLYEITVQRDYYLE